MNRLDVPAGHLSYAEADTCAGTRGPLVVLLHAGYADHSMWDRELTHLARRGHVVALDARTHGDSSTATQPFRHCDDVAALVRHLGEGPAVLVGVSMGAGAAVDTALEYPDLVEALIISGAGTSEQTFEDPWALGRIAEIQRAVEAQDAQRWCEVMLEYAAGPWRSLDEIDPAVVARLGEMHERFVRTHVRPGVVPPSPVENSWERLAEIGVPVLGIVGALDSPDHHRMCRRAVDGGRDGRGVVRIDSAGHYPNLEEPEQWERMVDSFLDDLEAIGCRR